LGRSLRADELLHEHADARQVAILAPARPRGQERKTIIRRAQACASIKTRSTLAPCGEDDARNERCFIEGQEENRIRDLSG
jgi:hypothetical protein